MFSSSLKKTGGVTHCDHAIYIKKYLKTKKKNYENSNISPYKNIIFQISLIYALRASPPRKGKQLFYFRLE